MNYGALFRSALVTLLRNKMRSVLTVLGITIGIAAVICVVAIGKAGQARVQQQLNIFPTLPTKDIHPTRPINSIRPGREQPRGAWRQWGNGNSTV